LVGVELASDVMECDVDGMGAVGDFRGFVVRVVMRDRSGRNGPCGLQIGLGLVHVAEVHGFGKGKMAADLGGSKVGPCGKMPSVNCVSPRG
jgi:hypothetical protein